MKHKEIISTLANRLDWSEAKVSELLQITAEAVGNYLSDSGSIALPGIGELISQKKSEYISHHTDTGERYLIPPAVKLGFKVAPQLEGAIEVDHLVLLVRKQRQEMNADDVTKLLSEWIKLQRELLLRQEEAETEPFGVFTCRLESDKDISNKDNNEDTGFLKYRIGFTPSELLEKLVNNHFSHFEPSLLNDGVEFNDLPIVKVGQETLDEVYDNLIVVPVPIERVDDPLLDSSVCDAPQSDETTPLQVDTDDSLKTDITPPQVNITPPRREYATKRSKRSSILIPVLGGVAIALAGLFFFNHPHTEK